MNSCLLLWWCGKCFQGRTAPSKFYITKCNAKHQMQWCKPTALLQIWKASEIDRPFLVVPVCAKKVKMEILQAFFESPFPIKWKLANTYLKSTKLFNHFYWMLNIYQSQQESTYILFLKIKKCKSAVILVCLIICPSIRPYYHFLSSVCRWYPIVPFF